MVVFRQLCFDDDDDDDDDGDDADILLTALALSMCKTSAVCDVSERQTAAL